MNERSLFLEALAKPPVDREAFLDRECGGDAELRKRIEELLRAHDSSKSFLDETQATSAFTPQPDHTQQVDQSVDTYRLTEAGTVIAGRYQLVELIGEGGMGEVWIADQAEPVKRQVAIKLIKAGMDSKLVLQRFNTERQALALMDHPNIAKVLDGGSTSDRRPFFVMELVNGLPLTRFCDDAQLSIRERLELFVAVCQAVQHAHQKGIVHRDLKPSNIMVTMINDRPAPKIIDFGVAKAVGGRLTDESLATQFGAVVGTLEYMSPEQAGITGTDVDTRADVYSLGVILYELLTGLRPIDSKRLRRAALTEMVRILKDEEPSKPSTRLSSSESLPSLAALRHTEPKKLMAVLRGELDWVVMKCLEKERKRRYETANGLARDLQRYLADEPVEARPPSAGYQFRKFYARHRRTVLAALLVLMALLGTVAVSITAAIMIWEEKQKTEAERQKATANADAAIKVVRDLSTYVHAIEFSGNQAISSVVQRREALDATLASYERLLALHPDDPDIRSNVARMHRYRANLSRSVNDTAAAAQSYREAIRNYSDLAASYPENPLYRENVSETSRDFGLFLNRIGRLKEATGILDQSVRVYEELVQANQDESSYQRRLANILVDRADLDYQLGRLPDCERTARKAMELYLHLTQTPGSHPETLDPLFRAMAGNRLAMALREQGKIDASVAMHDEVVNQLATQVKVNPTRDFLHAYQRFRTERAWTITNVPNRQREAVADLDDAISGWVKLGKQFPDSPLYLQYQGIAGMYRGRLNSLLAQRDAATRDLTAAAKVLAGLTEKYKDIIVYRYDLGRTYTALGKLATDQAEASRNYRLARTALEEAVQKDPENVHYRKALEDLNALPQAKP
jgi:tetratricopeptide (TPR) repeat protein/tRNA A-37 threonylcarbamoyl transferase component Bud32